MKILVTGSRGLVGYSLRKFLDGDVVWLDRTHCDLRESVQVDDVFRMHRPDIVVHLASRVGGVYENTSKNYLFFYDNVKININVIEACRKFNVKRIISVLSTCIFPDSSFVVYPLTSDQLHNGMCHPSNMGYAYSKRVLHVAGQLLGDSVEVVNLIPTNLYGENDNYNIDQAHVIPSIIHKTYLARLGGGKLRIFGSGNALRQFLHSDDLAKVICHFICAKLEQPVIDCIVSPPESDEMSIRSVVATVCDEFGYNHDNVIYDTCYSDGQFKKTTSDAELRKYLPNFEFTPFSRGISQTVKFFCKGNFRS
ncbi:NAD-dependent epimerase/dehydratase family protein [bacterium]|nr:NAD-dependent epimerase/dehydratase family protein [bacterium]NDC93961.1 NAD-dependent epimerase/dehydratase family protein [bacterium]NDD83456.1 NAD-dependent epimerase/dehydratase family protein [bacterium]NDG29081.1 NAD-dependent epimerase/dehydratase family protein [bacterium]